jgi:hypothetical protein
MSRTSSDNLSLNSQENSAEGQTFQAFRAAKLTGCGKKARVRLSRLEAEATQRM